uniref:Alkyl hydroperoxide reductase subunit C/ Thiol specific antioxidant domain-containing protein n=1 Tax=Oncorhynchus tshawytscha TaxID=74940 RepID=A0A8C8INC9_ONCTS
TSFPLLSSRWGVLFSHTQDFTPVCTTELACAAKINFEFKKRNFKKIALSIDSVADHLAWSKDVMPFNSESGCSPLPFPIIADDEGIDKDGMPLTALCVFVVGPDKKMKLSIMYPSTTGRSSLLLRSWPLLLTGRYTSAEL